MRVRLPSILKDAALTAFVAAALGIFIVGFRTVDVGSRTGLSFDYQLADLAVAVGAIFVGRIGLSLAAAGLRWPVVALGAAMMAVGASPLQLPSGFLHWFVALGGVMLMIRGIWPWARGTLADTGGHHGHAQVVDHVLIEHRAVDDGGVVGAGGTGGGSGIDGLVVATASTLGCAAMMG